MSGGGRRSPPHLRSKGGADLPSSTFTPPKPNAGFASVSRGPHGRFVSSNCNGTPAAGGVEGRSTIEEDGGLKALPVAVGRVEQAVDEAMVVEKNIQQVSPHLIQGHAHLGLSVCEDKGGCGFHVEGDGTAEMVIGGAMGMDSSVMQISPMEMLGHARPGEHKEDWSGYMNGNDAMGLEEEVNAINENCKKDAAACFPGVHQARPGDYKNVGTSCAINNVAMDLVNGCGPTPHPLGVSAVPMRLVDGLNVFNGVAQAATATCTQGARFNACLEKQDWTASKSAWSKPNLIAAPPLKNLEHLAAINGVAQLDTNEVESFFSKFKAAVVGRLFGKHIPYHHLRMELKRRWDRFGDFQLVTLSNECFVCTFASVEARDAILMGGPWLVAGQVLGLDRWTPDFTLSTLHGFVTPIWVRFPGLPLYCWGINSLTSISSLLGEPIWIEEAAHEFSRGSFARACVRLDLSKSLLPFVWVQGHEGPFKQKVEYEGFTAFCQQCGRVGHKLPHCPLNVKLPKSSPQGVPPHPIGKSTFKFAASRGIQCSAPPTTEGASGDARPADVQDVHPPTVPRQPTVHVEEDGNGSWLLAPRRRRSRKAAKPKGRDLLQDKMQPPTHHTPSDSDAQLLTKSSTKGRPLLFPFDAAPFTARGSRRVRKGREVTHKGKAIFLQSEGSKNEAIATQEPPKKRKSLVYAVDEDASSFVPP